jgi:flagellar hook-basal body complex protein FliE
MDVIAPLGSASALARPAGLHPGAAAGAAGGFGAALAQALEGVNQAQDRARSLGQRFQLGDESVSLEETMIAMQKSSIAFQAAVQARNRLVSAYHDVMNMSV